MPTNTTDIPNLPFNLAPGTTLTPHTRPRFQVFTNAHTHQPTPQFTPQFVD